MGISWRNNGVSYWCNSLSGLCNAGLFRRDVRCRATPEKCAFGANLTTEIAEAAEVLRILSLFTSVKFRR